HGARAGDLRSIGATPCRPRRSQRKEPAMRSLSLAVASLMVFATASLVTGEEKKDDNKTLLVGVWELTKGESLPPGSTLEFTKDGKLKLTVEPEKGKKITIDGTYEVKGDSILVTMKEGDKEHKETLTIKLSKDELTTIDEKKKSDTFK